MQSSAPSPFDIPDEIDRARRGWPLRAYTSGSFSLADEFHLRSDSLLFRLIGAKRSPRRAGKGRQTRRDDGEFKENMNSSIRPGRRRVLRAPFRLAYNV